MAQDNLRSPREPTPTVLTLTNCEAAPTIAMLLRHCADGHFGGKPTPDECSACTVRRPRDAKLPAVEFVTLRVKAPVAVPRAQWPWWAKRIAAKRADDDTGVGDTFKRWLGKPGELIEATTEAAGVDCGCSDRRARWNALYPYEAVSPS